MDMNPLLYTFLITQYTVLVCSIVLFHNQPSITIINGILINGILYYDRCYFARGIV